MIWYAANIVNVIRVRNGTQGSYPIWEDVYLIEAATDEEAVRKAEALGKENESDDPSLTYDGVPARMEFVGVRKVVRVRNAFPAHPDEIQPTNGTEITYSKYTVATEKDVARFASGEKVDTVYEE